MAKNIEAQLREYVGKINLKRLEHHFIAYKDKDRCAELRYALAQGFFMNTCRKVSSMQKKDGAMVYLSVADGTFVRTDREQSAIESADYVIYT